MPSLEQWEALKPGYRQRLIRGGYTREDYLANVPRVAQRGHARTPEHKARALRRKPTGGLYYPEYVGKHIDGRPVTNAERKALYDKMRREFMRVFESGETNRTSHGRDAPLKRIDAGTLEYAIYKASNRLFRYMETLDATQWRANASTPYQGDDWDDPIVMNPFFYH